MTAVGIVGLGLLGSALASRLLAGGHEVVGYDIVPERVTALTALGGAAAASAEEVGEVAETVCVVLPSLAAVQEAILGSHGVAMRARAGSVVMQMSTISPALTERLAKEVTASGLAFLDAPVSGTSSMVARGEGLIIAGGEPGIFERCRPMLEVMLPTVVYVGPAGHATFVKLVANLLVALHSAAAAEALALAAKAGLDLDVVLRVLTAGAAGSRMLEVRGPLMIRDEFPPQMKLALFMKDLHLIQDAARAVSAGIPLTDVAERLYGTVFEAGFGDQDLAVVVKALHALSR